MGPTSSYQERMQFAGANKRRSRKWKLSLSKDGRLLFCVVRSAPGGHRKTQACHTAGRSTTTNNWHLAAPARPKCTHVTNLARYKLLDRSKVAACFSCLYLSFSSQLPLGAWVITRPPDRHGPAWPGGGAARLGSARPRGRRDFKAFWPGCIQVSGEFGSRIMPPARGDRDRPGPPRPAAVRRRHWPGGFESLTSHLACSLSPDRHGPVAAAAAAGDESRPGLTRAGPQSQRRAQDGPPGRHRRGRRGRGSGGPGPGSESESESLAAPGPSRRRHHQ